nr:putative reverse transcriptase domain-containing protein [Tanacetum cinerariifolium]
PPRLRLGFAKIFCSALDNVLMNLGDISVWVQLLLCHVVFCLLLCPLTELNEDLVLMSSGVAPSAPDSLHELEAKHPFAPPLTLSSSPLGVQSLFIHKDLVLNRICSFPKGTSYCCNGLRAQHLMDILGGVAFAVANDLLGSITGGVN